MTSQTFTSTGTWTAPSGVSSVDVQCWGEGGAGGTSSSFGGAGGGGGGEYAENTAVPVTAGNVYNFTIGAGGSATDTAFTGDAATVVTAHHGANGTSSGGGAGGAGGSGSTAPVHSNGGTGGNGGNGGALGGGGGGGSAGAAGTGGAGVSPGGGTGGAGGSAGTGPPAGAAGGAGGNGGVSSTAGTAGSAPGGGGGGGGGGGTHSGGAGQNGQVTLTWTAVPPPGSAPLIPPQPFTPMALRFWQPPPVPVFNFTGTYALAPLATSGSESPPVFTGTYALAPLATSAAVAYEFPFPGTPLGITVELLINGTWQDITSYVYSRQDVVITRGRPDEGQQVQPSTLKLILGNLDGRFSLSNPAGAYAPYLTRNTQIRVSLNTWSAQFAPYSGYRFWGEISAIAPRWDPSGNDRYAEVTASGPLRRFSQGNAKIGSALRRYYTRLTGSDFAPYGYWPAEDADHAAEIASAITGVGAMAFTGSPTFGSDSAFGGSDPIPAVNGSSWHGQTSAASSPPGAGSLTQPTPGTYTFRCPPGVSSVSVDELVGGGGGGGAAGGTQGGGGGGGGGTAKNTSVAVTAGTVYSYTVGAGGAPGTTLGTQGQPGAASSWPGDSVTPSAPGGQAGIGGDVSTGGAGGVAGPGGHAGGAGASGSASTTSFQSGSLSAPSGGSGGGAAGHQVSTAVTFAAAATVNIAAVGGGGGGAGGASGAAGHGGGGGGGGGYSAGTTTVSPGASLTFTAGGGGAGGTAAHGGAGADSTVSDGSVTGGGGSAGSGSGTAGSGGSGTTASGSHGGTGGSPSGPAFGGGGGGGGSGSSPGNGSAGSGRSPGGGGGSGSGGGWGASSSGLLSSCTTGGTGGQGGGGGGGGAATNTVGKVGGGGGGGFIEWDWTLTGVPAGGGGGSSAGSASDGNAGSTTGTGGAAVTGGGAGGNQGKTGASPGGGGGGGYPPPAAGGSVTQPGAGGPGLVSFSWTGGTVSPVAADIFRFLLNVDKAGGPDGTVLARAVTFGTVARMDVIYHTGGNLQLAGYNGSGTLLFDSGSQAFGVNGAPVMVSVELTANGSGGAAWKLTAVQPGAGVAVATFTGTVASVAVGFISDVYASPNADVTFASVGQMTAQTYAPDIAAMSDVINGYAGELCADRLSRLAAEEGLTFTLVGSDTDTPQMGPQQDDTLVNVLVSCEELDRGQLFEPRDSLGIAYRTRLSMQGQNPALTLDYSLAQLAGTLQPVSDDQFTRNDVTITRNNGSSATAVLTSGAMSTADPPNGVGDYTYSLTVQAFADSQLANLAAWMLTVGTVGDDRYPVISADLARTAVVALFGDIATLDIGDYIQVINPPSWLTSMPISQLAWGVTETLNTFKWVIDWNSVPESPYSEGNPPTW